MPLIPARLHSETCHKRKFCFEIGKIFFLVRTQIQSNTFSMSINLGWGLYLSLFGTFRSVVHVKSLKGGKVGTNS